MPIYTEEPEQPFIKPIRSERLQSSVGIGPRGNGIYFCDKEFEYSEGGTYTAQKSEFVQVRHHSIYDVRIGDIVLFKIERDGRNVLCVGVIESISQDVVTFREVDEIRVITDGQIQTTDIADGSVTADKLANDAVPDFVGASGSQSGTHGLVPASPASGILTNGDLLWGDGEWAKLGIEVNEVSNGVDIGLLKGSDDLQLVSIHPADRYNAGVMSSADKIKLDGLSTSVDELSDDVTELSDSVGSMADITFTLHVEGYDSSNWIGIKDRKSPSVEYRVAQVDGDGHIISVLKDGSVTGSKLANDSVTGNKLTDGSVTNDKLAINSITGSKIANNSIGGTKIADGSIGNGKLMENSVNTANIVDGAVTDAKISGAILGSKIAPGTIQSTQIASNAIDRSKIVDGAITTAKIADGAVTSGRIAIKAVNEVNINNNAVTDDKIRDLAVTTNKLAAGAVTFTKLARGAVNETSIADYAVTTDKIRGLAVTTAKLADGAVSTNKIADGAVVSTKLANSSVTFGKLAEDAVRTAQIHDSAVTTAKIKDKAVTSDKLADDMLDAIYNTVHDGITGGGPLDTASWVERACPGTDGPARIESIHGKTVVWNQLVPTRKSTGTTYGITMTATNGVYTVTGTGTLDSGSLRATLINIQVPANHKVYASIRRVSTGATNNDGISVADGFAHEFNPSFPTQDASTIFECTTGTVRFFTKPCLTTLTMDMTLTPQFFDLTRMFGAGNEPATVAEFEALFPEPYYPYDAGSLLPVRMTGVESVGFNQWDEVWESGQYSSADGTKTNNSNKVRCKNPISVFPSTTYYYKGLSGTIVYFYDADGTYISYQSISADATFTTPANAWQMTFAIGSSGTPVTSLTIGTVCISLNGPRNGEYEPYWRYQLAIDAGVLRGAGSVYDELTATERIVRVGERAYQSGDESDPSVVTDGTVTHYALATPTTTPIDPALNMTYKAAEGGTERILHTVPTAPPTMVVQYGSTADGIRDRALEAIAAHDGPIAQTYHAVGTYLTMGGSLYRVTTAIAAGERITQGTNVVATTVMAEVLALTQ